MEETMRQTLLALARQARHSPTPAENTLWERLRDHRCGGLHFRRQEIVGPSRLDFSCRRAKLAVEKLAVEVDGSVHQIESVQRRDTDRQQILEQEFSIHFLRVTNDDVRYRLEQIITDIKTRTAYLIAATSHTSD